MRRFRQFWVAGSFINPTDGSVNSLTGVQTSSLSTFADVTVNSITGAAGWRGIATMNSGTTVASVAATAARSGAIINVTINMYASILSSQAFVGVGVSSVRAGAFEIRAIGSAAPIGDVPLMWEIIR